MEEGSRLKEHATDDKHGKKKKKKKTTEAPRNYYKKKKKRSYTFNDKYTNNRNNTRDSRGRPAQTPSDKTMPKKREPVKGEIKSASVTPVISGEFHLAANESWAPPCGPVILPTRRASHTHVCSSQSKPLVPFCV